MDTDTLHPRLRSPRRPLVGTPHDVGVLARPFPLALRCLSLAHRGSWGGRRHEQGPWRPLQMGTRDRARYQAASDLVCTRLSRWDCNTLQRPDVWLVWRES